MYLIYALCFFLFLCLLGYFFGLSPKIYIKRCLVSFDQFINTWFFFGYEDETLSSRAFRWSDDVKNSDDGENKTKEEVKNSGGIKNATQNVGKNNAKNLGKYGSWHIQKMPANIINALFFWDYIIDEDGDKVRHCELSFWSERERSQMHPEGR